MQTINDASSLVELLADWRIIDLTPSGELRVCSTDKDITFQLDMNKRELFFMSVMAYEEEYNMEWRAI